jgi:hypothetical protein
LVIDAEDSEDELGENISLYMTTYIIAHNINF